MTTAATAQCTSMANALVCTALSNDQQCIDLLLNREVGHLNKKLIDFVFRKNRNAAVCKQLYLALKRFTESSNYGD